MSVKKIKSTEIFNALTTNPTAFPRLYKYMGKILTLFVKFDYYPNKNLYAQVVYPKRFVVELNHLVAYEVLKVVLYG